MVCQFVDDRHREAVLREVHCLDVMLGSVEASLTLYMVTLGRGVHGKFLHSFFAARRTENSPERPLGGT